MTLVPKDKRTAAALYIYTSGSPFEDVVNQYMSLGMPIVPPNLESQLRVLGNYTLSNSSSYSNLTAMPILSSLPQDVFFLDSES